MSPTIHLGFMAFVTLILRWFLSPYIEPQVSCQQSASPLGLIFMVCVSLQVSMTCVALPFMVHFSCCVLYFFTSIYILWLLSLLISRGRPKLTFVVPRILSPLCFSFGSISFRIQHAFSIVTDLPRNVHKGSFQTTCDDKSGYDHIRLSPDSRTWFGLQWNAWYFVFNTLPFGWKVNTYLYHSIGVVATSYIRSHGVLCSQYIDDRRFWATSNPP